MMSPIFNLFQTILQRSCSSLELELRERKSADKKNDPASTTLDESKKKIFYLDFDTPTNTNETCTELEDQQDIRRRRMQQGVSCSRSNDELRRSSLSLEFDMLTGLVIDVDDDEDADDYDGKSAEDKGSNLDEDERIAAADDDQTICVLSGPPTSNHKEDQELGWGRMGRSRIGRYEGR